MIEQLEQNYAKDLLENLNFSNSISKFESLNLESLEENLSEVTLFKINELTFDENEKNPRREAFENVLGSLRGEGINFIYLILGNKRGVSFYFGIVRNLKNIIELPLNVQEMGEALLKSSIQGNFRGSKITKLTPLENKEILQKIKSSKRFGNITGVPGINESNDKNSFQGIDRLIDVMQGEEFGLCILASPINDVKIKTIEKQLYSIYDKLSIFSKRNIQSGVNNSKSIGETKGENSSISKGKSTTVGTSTNKSATISSGTNKTTSFSIGENKSQTEGTSIGSSTGKSETNTSGSSKSTSINTGETEGKNKSNTCGTSSTNTTTEGTNENKSSGKTIGKSESKGNTKTTTTGTSISSSYNKTEGNTYSVSAEVHNKEIQEWLKYLDEILFPIIDYGKSKGIYLTNSFVFSDNNGTLIKLGNTMRSLFSGRKGNKMPLNLELLDKDDERVKCFKNFQIPEYNTSSYSENIKDALVLHSKLGSGIKNEYGNWISANELSLIAGLPQKEVVGLSLKEEVEFGLNVKESEEKEKILLGNLIQSGNELDIEISLDKKDLNKHIFVTGVTGTGKTTTCQKLLLESEMPFLVIEPAKTEYRILIDEARTKDILIFTLGKDMVAPFRLNPFEFFEHESITSRVDMLKAAMEASFDMEAAIPQLLESSMYECYKDYGWNILTNKNKKFENPFAQGVCSFPTLKDLLEKIEIEVEKQGFDERLKKDYIGSIKARLQGLLVGSKGIMLNVSRGIDFRELIERKVVLEIEEIKNGSEKSLIMGFVLTNLCEALKAKYRKNRNFKHITLIEEAHRLLAKFTPGDSSNKKQAIETFADMLAEVRKYGESLIIADQIPNKLTSEVLKNTNTKIVHKLFAEDDKEAIGNTMSLSSEQKKFLSSLNTGRAIVFSQGWDKALQVQIKQSTNTTGDRYVEDEELKERIKEFYQKTNIILGLNYLDRKATDEEFEFCKMISSYNEEIKIFKEVLECKIRNFSNFEVIFNEFLLNDEIWKIFEKIVTEKIDDKEKILYLSSQMNSLLKNVNIDLDILEKVILKKHYKKAEEECGREVFEDLKTELNQLLKNILEVKEGNIDIYSNMSLRRLKGNFKK